MNLEKLPKNEIDQRELNLDVPDDDTLSGGSNRLTYVLVGLIATLVLGFVALPKGEGTALAAVTPTFMLDDATVTGAAASRPAASVPAAQAEDDDDETQTAARPAPKTNGKFSAASPQSIAAAAAPSATTPVAPNSAESAAAAAFEPAATAAAPEPVTPATITVAGQIEDENGRPLVGATVLLRGSSKGASTDANGNYTLEVPAGTDNTLVYGYGGYDDEEVRARGSQPVNVTLTPRAKASRKRR